MKNVSLVPFMVLPLTLAALFSSSTGFVALVAIVCLVIEMFKAAAQERMESMVIDFVISFAIVIIGFIVSTCGLINSWAFVKSFAWIISMIVATADVLVGTIIKFFRLRRDFGPIGG